MYTRLNQVMDHTRINKYLSHKATEEEVAEIFEWINKSSENKALFIKYKKAWALTAISKENTALNLKQVQNTIQKNKRKNPFNNILKYAAIFIGLIGIGYLVNKESSTVQKLKIDETVITLKLNNGEVETLIPNGSKKILTQSGAVVGIQEGTALNYEHETEGMAALVAETLEYNELNIPFGKTFKLILSDGTQVSLNAGSSLKYPVKFIEGKNRQVFLKGEANFEVSKDTNHPFVVNVNEMNVRVLGTKFNMSSYPEDSNYTTVLIEGSVGIYKNGTEFSINNSTLLEPGYRARWNKNSEEITLDKVNTNIYTGWLYGKLIFKNAPFKNIRKKLERHYNVTIINNNKVLDEKTYNATFDIESIEEVLEILNKNFAIEYSIKNNQIIIN